MRLVLRFRLLLLLAAVAAIALALGGFLEVRRLSQAKADYARRASSHARMKAGLRALVDKQLEQARFWDEQAAHAARMAREWGALGQPHLAASQRESEDRNRRRASDSRERARALDDRAAYYATLHRKYERAAGSPWRSVPPDPPEPPRPVFDATSR